MESISKIKKQRVARPADEDKDPVGPMMVWNGDRSAEDIQWMSNWFLARKAELEKEKAQSAGKAE